MGTCEPSAQNGGCAKEIGGNVAATRLHAQRLFMLTNRMNLLGILSSRVVAPRESFRKYYADLLELMPGWVPVLTEPPPASLIERVAAERGAVYPVLLELMEPGLEDHFTSHRMIYVRAVPLSRVKAIHFREEKSLREHRARAYRNVHAHDHLLRVSPELFALTVDPEVVIEPPPRGAAKSWVLLDRIRGAISAVFAAVDSGESLALVAGLLGESDLPADVVLPRWLSWGALICEQSEVSNESDAEQADWLIFRSAYRQLSAQDRADSWRPSEILRAVVTDVLATNPSYRVRATVERNLQRVRELVDLELDFEPFSNSGRPNVAAKSLAMVLLRPDLGQLLAWPTEQTGADDATRAVSAILAGCLRGLAREAVELRNVAIDDLTAEWAVRAANGQASSLGTVEFVSSRTSSTLLLSGVLVGKSGPLASSVHG